jgi:hypothetical protein
MSLGKRIETNGATLVNLAKCLGPMAERLFAEQGLGLPDALEWYPLDKVLAVLDRVGEMVGDAALFRAGQSAPRLALAGNVPRALAALDVAYHQAHRKDGQPMHNAANGKLTDGIGHYIVAEEEPGLCVLDSASRYPCPYDLGLVTATVRRFNANAVIDHLDSSHCRRRGSATCKYIVTW